MQPTVIIMEKQGQVAISTSLGSNGTTALCLQRLMSLFLGLLWERFIFKCITQSSSLAKLFSYLLHTVNGNLDHYVQAKVEHALPSLLSTSVITKVFVNVGGIFR